MSLPVSITLTQAKQAKLIKMMDSQKLNQVGFEVLLEEINDAGHLPNKYDENLDKLD